MGKAVSDKTFGLCILINSFEIPFPCDVICSICLLCRYVSFACLLTNTIEAVVSATEVKADMPAITKKIKANRGKAFPSLIIVSLNVELSGEFLISSGRSLICS